MQDIFIWFVKNVICKRKWGRVTMVQGKRIREYRVWGWSTMEMETRGQGVRVRVGYYCEEAMSGQGEGVLVS